MLSADDVYWQETSSQEMTTLTTEQTDLTTDQTETMETQQVKDMEMLGMTETEDGSRPD